MHAMTDTYVTYGAMLLVSLIACITDLRSGEIPDRLTLSTGIVALLFGAFFGGWRGFVTALIGILVCAIVPIIAHKVDGMGGGDVKLFAALGGLAGPGMGLEVELLSLCVAFVWGLGVVAYRGRLWSALGNSGQLVFNAFLPPSRRREVAPEALTRLRIGAAIFAGTVLAVIDRLVLGGLVP
jgi:prepilin peptidase CpaA